MKYINLIDYVGKPELIQHVDGREVHALVHCPDSLSSLRMVVVFKNGGVSKYCEDGKHTSDSASSSFILRPNPKKVVKGYRKVVLCSSGSIDTDPLYRRTKEEFEKLYCYHTLLGEWQEVEYEIEE